LGVLFFLFFSSRYFCDYQDSGAFPDSIGVHLLCRNRGYGLSPRGSCFFPPSSPPGRHKDAPFSHQEVEFYFYSTKFNSDFLYSPPPEEDMTYFFFFPLFYLKSFFSMECLFSSPLPFSLFPFPPPASHLKTSPPPPPFFVPARVSVHLRPLGSLFFSKIRELIPFFLPPP